MKFAAIVAGFLAFGAGLAVAAGPPAVTEQAKVDVRAEQAGGDGPADRKMSKEERLIRKRCEDVERFVSRWPDHAEMYVTAVRLEREAEHEFEGNGEPLPEFSARELRDLHRDACHAWHGVYGTDIVGKHSEKITLYETLAEDIKEDISENVYNALSPKLRVRLHQMNSLNEELPPEMWEELDDTSYLVMLPEDLFKVRERNTVIKLREATDRIEEAKRMAARGETEAAKAELEEATADAARIAAELERIERAKRFRR